MSLTKVTYAMIADAAINVVDYGADPTGTQDSTAAILAAIATTNGNIYLPDGTYKITSKITLGQGQTMFGSNPNKVFLVHEFNGDMFEMLEKSQLRNITFTGQGSTYTGKGLIFTGTNGRQYVENCWILDFEGAAIWFEDSAGSQSCFVNVKATRTGAIFSSNIYCVVVEDTGYYDEAVPRSFYNYMSGGFTAFDFGSCNNFFVHGGYIGSCKFSDSSRAVLFSGVRVAYYGNFDIKGGNHAFSGCDFGGAAPETVITSGSGITIEGCTFNYPPVNDSAVFGQNQISCRTVAYTPVLTTSGTAPSLGNGTINGRATRSGSVVTVTIEFTMGSTTTLGTGELYFSLPAFYPNRNDLVASNGTAIFNRSTTLYTGVTQAAAVTQYVRIISGNAPVTATAPATFASGDVFRLQLSYIS